MKARVINRPRAGFFKVRAHRTVPGQRAVWLPAMLEWIYPVDPVTQEVLDRSPTLEASINGAAAEVERVWMAGFEITEDEYQWLIAVTAIRQS
jgi:hypothetical protein